MAENTDKACGVQKSEECSELENVVEVKDSIHNSLSSFAGFVHKRVLNSNSGRKLMFLEGTFDEKSGSAVVVLEKEPFSEDSLKFLLNDGSTLKKVSSNDVYGTYECSPRQEYNTIKTTVIHPATKEHIKKYESQIFHFIEETPELYQTVTLPHLQKDKFDIQWVDNILCHKSEEERIVFEDPDPDLGFILLPDLKWNCKTIEDLYLMAIVHNKGVKSLRDLTGAHLNLLENLLNKGCEVIEEKYKLPRSQQRVYIHYQPSYYHFHVHYTNLKYDAPGINIGRAHLLSAVIQNVKLMSDYYQKVVLPFIVGENSSLFAKYEEIGLVKKAAEPSNQMVDVAQE